MPQEYTVHHGLYTFPGDSFQVQLRRVQRDSLGRLFADVAILTGDGKGYLALDRGDLSSGRFRESLAGQAARRNATKSQAYDNLLLAAYIALQADSDVSLVTPPPAPMRAEEFLKTVAPSGLPLVEGLIERGSLYSVASKPKVGKTILCLNLAVAVSQGRKWLGREVVPGRALVFQLEDPARVLRHRLEAMAGGEAPQDLWIQTKTFRLTPDNWDASVKAGQGFALVVVDPLILAVQVDDFNDQTQVRQAYDLWRRFAKETGAAVVTASHHRKLEGEFGEQMAGSIQGQAAVDGIVELYRDHKLGRTQRRLSLVGRDWAERDDQVLQLDPERFWWEVVGPCQEVVQEMREAKREREAQEVLDTLPDAPPGLTAAELSLKLVVANQRIYESLKSLGERVKSAGKRSSKTNPQRFWRASS